VCERVGVYVGMCERLCVVGGIHVIKQQDSEWVCALTVCNRLMN
jgi:hypothetical protein